MYKEKFKYTDYNGVEREEDFYFDLSEAEVMEMDLITPGGLGQMLQNIVDANDAAGMITEFKKILLKAYGEKSPDGKRFVKNETTQNNFMYSPVYSTMFMKLATDAEYASNFINAVVPKPKNTDTPATLAVVK